MGKYEKVVVYAPVDEISRTEWDEKVNGQKFDCNLVQAKNQLSEICPNIHSMSIETLCNKSNDEEYLTEYWVGVINYINED
jgi:hypothetical protein